jgi:hypothetical protein
MQNVIQKIAFGTGRIPDNGIQKIALGISGRIPDNGIRKTELRQNIPAISRRTSISYLGESGQGCGVYFGGIRRMGSAIPGRETEVRNIPAQCI